MISLRFSLAGWVGAFSELLIPLVSALRDHVLAAEKVHADDTPVPVPAPSSGRRKGGRPADFARMVSIHADCLPGE